MSKIDFSFSHDGRVALICLNNGSGNILDHEMLTELRGIFVSLLGKNELSLIVFSGYGKNFSFGASVKEHLPAQAAGMLKDFHGFIYSIFELSVPTLALVSGQCLGGGMELALACNFIFADSTAKFGQPEISLGVFPPPASVILPHKLGSAKAEELLITGKSVSADLAFSMGLINQVFQTREEMTQGTEAWIQKYILPKSASSLRYAVRAARFDLNARIKEDLPLLEKLYLEELMQTHDAQEGIASYVEKRVPVWLHN